MADSRNAHIRRQSARQAPEVEISDAERFINDPVFERAFDGLRDALVAELENMRHDGSAGADDYTIEIARTLRTLKALKRNIVVSMQGQKLQLANIDIQGESH